MRFRFFVLFLLGCAALTVGVFHPPAVAADAPTFPMLAALEQFVAPGIPGMATSEGLPSRNWPQPKSIPERPGHGLAEHPMLYAGEGYNTVFLVNHGKVVWTFSAGGRGEIDDIWLLSNGHVLFSSQYHVQEVTPQKQIVWHYDAPPGTEVHTCQPLGLDKVMIVRNGLPPKLMVLNKHNGETEEEHDLPAESFVDTKTIHAQFRRARFTAAGTYLLAFLRMNKVVEYDKDFNPMWSCAIATPWAAVRLHNGNTLITDERDRLVREVNTRCETVWELKQSDLPADLALRNMQTADRLTNGNTVIFSSTAGAKPNDWPSLIQAVEVTPDKKVVWALQDWKNLGPATTAQFLDQPGFPEKAGDLQR